MKYILLAFFVSGLSGIAQAQEIDMIIVRQSLFHDITIDPLVIGYDTVLRSEYERNFMRGLEARHYYAVTIEGHDDFAYIDSVLTNTPYYEEGTDSTSPSLMEILFCSDTVVVRRIVIGELKVNRGHYFEDVIHALTGRGICMYRIVDYFIRYCFTFSIHHYRCLAPGKD